MDINDLSIEQLRSRCTRLESQLQESRQDVRRRYRMEPYTLYQPVMVDADGKDWPLQLAFLNHITALDVAVGYENAVKGYTQELIVFADPENYRAYRRDEVRRRALDKLTLEEREVLGLVPHGVSGVSGS